MPEAATAILTSPGPSSGSGRSSTFSTSGPPRLVITTARIALAAYPIGLGGLSEIDRPAVDEALGGHDLLQHLLGRSRAHARRRRRRRPPPGRDGGDHR